MVERPLSILTKAERNSVVGLLDTDALLMHYEDVYASRFRWEGGPEGMDPSWPERMLFRFGLLGTAEAFGAAQLAAGNVGLKGIYDQPLNWLPVCEGTVIPEGWMKPHEGPVVYIPFVPRTECQPLCELMSDAWRCMKSNILSMSQPVLVQGTPGSEINVKEAKDSIYGLTPMILTLDRSAVEAKSLDLGGKDHTESLIKVINDIDCEILARFGIKLISSKTIKTSYFGICKQVGYVCVNTTDSVLQPGVYPIVEGNADGTITAGYRVDEEETLGGSRLLYAVSADLKNGIVTPIHQWRMSSGEMVLDEAGNISLNFTTYNGTSVTATAKYDFSPATTGVEDVEVFRSSEVQKVLREGQLLIEHKGQWYTVLGYRL